MSDARAITIAIYEDGWQVSTHLQVSKRSFRYYATMLNGLDDVMLFLSQWNTDWKTAAMVYFGYEGIEDITEVDYGPISPSLESIAAALLPPKPPITRRF